MPPFQRRKLKHIEAKVTQLVNGRARIGSQAIWFRACVEVVAKGRRSLRLPVREGDVLWWDSEPTAL